MPSDYEHYQSILNRLREHKRALEQRLRETEEAIHAMELGAKLVQGIASVDLKAEVVRLEKPAAERSREGVRIQNRNVTELVREYLGKLNPTSATSFEDLRDACIDRRKLIEWLQSNGVKGNYRSLYSSVSVILSKEAERGVIKRLPNVGFYKSAESVESAATR